MVKVNALGNNSFRVRFSYPLSQGHDVALAGIFNDWDPTANKMLFSVSDAVYVSDVILPSGTYEYKLVVDGDWLCDEENPNFVSNDFGTLNSVVTVK